MRKEMHSVDLLGLKNNQNAEFLEAYPHTVTLSRN